jgi:hypothetical protein
MLSTHLAELYQVEPRALVQAVKRNIERFPADFMFRLSAREFANLKSQLVISSWGGARRAAPYAFMEQGVAMLSSVLRIPFQLDGDLLAPAGRAPPLRTVWQMDQGQVAPRLITANPLETEIRSKNTIWHAMECRPAERRIPQLIVTSLSSKNVRIGSANAVPRG